MHARPIQLGLDRVRAVATRLRLPPAIPALTVAGTNGKGSSASLLAGIYRAAGWRVGIYTSPHLLRYNERIAIDGRAACDAELCAAFAAIEQARSDVPLTYFEFGTLAALWVFRERQVQVQVLEVGLGGRLDAVNLVDAQGMLITAIGLDHQDWLGADREAIAGEKAGILRPGKPAIYADPAPTAAVAQAARQTGAPLQSLGKDFNIQIVADAWNWLGPSRAYKKLPMPGLSGMHQLHNAAGALALVECLQARLPVPESAIRSALPRLTLPGRFERHGRVILDVAHNVEAVEALCRQLRSHGLGSLILILGMLADKPVGPISRLLAPLTSTAFLAGLPGPRGLDAASLHQRCGDVFAHAHCCGSVAEAYAAAVANARPGEHILACGSFLTVAAVKALIEPVHG